MKDPVKRMERQVTDWRKCISGKGLISRIFFLTFKALHQKNSLVRKWAKYMSRDFIEEDI